MWYFKWSRTCQRNSIKIFLISKSAVYLLIEVFSSRFSRRGLSRRCFVHLKGSQRRLCSYRSMFWGAVSWSSGKVALKMWIWCWKRFPHGGFGITWTFLNRYTLINQIHTAWYHESAQTPIKSAHNQAQHSYLSSGSPQAN